MEGGDDNQAGFDADNAVIIRHFLQEGQRVLTSALRRVNSSVEQVRALGVVPLTVSRALDGIVACHNTLHHTSQQIQIAVTMVVQMVQEQQPILNLGPHISLIGAAEDELNATAVSVHSHLLVLTKAQVHRLAQSDLHTALAYIHLALCHFQRAIGRYRYPNEIAFFEAADNPELDNNGQEQ